MAASADIVIVGGGIVGSAAAYFLSVHPATRGQRIMLIERDPTYAEASTARSAGGLRQQFSTPENIALSQATLAMIRNLKSLFGPGADVGFREQGYLLLASPEGRDILADNVAVQTTCGADVALLAVPALADRFAWLETQGLACGAHGMTGEGWFDPASCADLLRRAAREQGVQLLPADAVALTLSGAQGHTITCRDGSVLAQMSTPDMRAPISYSLAWPSRMQTPCARLDLARLSSLTFEAPDETRFPALGLARQVMAAGGSAGAVLNAANEVAVAAFLGGRLSFTGIARLASRTMEAAERRGLIGRPADLDELMQIDAASRTIATELAVSG